MNMTKSAPTATVIKDIYTRITPNGKSVVKGPDAYKYLSTLRISLQNTSSPPPAFYALVSVMKLSASFAALALLLPLASAQTQVWGQCTTTFHFAHG